MRFRDLDVEIECDCRHHQVGESLEEGCGAVWTQNLPTDERGDIHVEVSCPTCLHRFEYSIGRDEHHDPCAPDRLEDLYD